MNRDELIRQLVSTLKDTMKEQSTGGEIEVSSTSSLVGPEAVLTSMALVSFITDVESTLYQQHSVEITLVSEQALSRTSSPFRTLETLADYILELVGAQFAGKK